jgi:hypothetical protein
MPTSIHRLFFMPLLLLLCQLPLAAPATTQFQQWYPEWAEIFDKIVHDNCTAEYTAYRTMKKSDAPVQYWTGGNPTNRLVHPVVNCILQHTPEFIKANMGSAGVILGLTPMILATMGNSVEEISTLVVVGRRPILGLCLAAGSPAVAPARFFEYLNPWNLLENRLYRLRPKQFSTRGEVTVIVLEFVFAVAVIANTISLGVELGLRVCNTFAPHLTYLPLLWSILVLAIHISGIIALWVRTTSVRRCNYISVYRLVREQFLPLDNRITANLTFKDESYVFLAMAWFTCILSICHVISGTLVFSSMLFISVRDSVTVIARYMASALLCRVILMYKLSLLRNFHNMEREDDTKTHKSTTSLGEPLLPKISSV